MNTIHLISGPRNLSTAIMYSFSERPDCATIDEPYYAHYLLKTGKDHPGRLETIEAQSHDPQRVKANLQKLASEHEELFLKDMAHHQSILDSSYYSDHKVILLIRDPKALITSFSKVIHEPTLKDIGLEDEYHILLQLKELNTPFVVLDSSNLLSAPEQVLRETCEELEIPFYRNQLNWSAGPRPFDGPWAKYWYKSVHNSTGFAPQKSTSTQLPDHLKGLYSKALPFYQELYTHAIKP